ncbi:hypothetical protein [Sulfurivirga sp.]|uniref:hypothetical protein n=1 Tax=Sulfurivirga sp. TaxID=2614236 RepID=UPI0025ECA752|nr:hypothetical protein [Sulfurivirga sp.]
MPNSDEMLDLLAEVDSPAADAPAQKKPGAGGARPSEVLLSATEQAQEAAELAQLAADRTLALGKQQKESLIEMTEALGSWRHASRSALKEIKTARNRVGIMVGLTAFLTVSALGGGAWILWQLKKQGESVKADMLDLLQTQLNLQNQKIQLKIDELASVVEALQRDLKNMGPSSHQASMTPVRILPPGAEASSTEPLHEPQAGHDGHAQVEAHGPATPHAADTHTAAEAEPAPAHAPAPIHDAPAHAAAAPAAPVDLTPLAAQLDELKTQLQQLLARQQAMHATPSVPAPHGGASPELARQLNEVRRLVAEQSKQLKIIRAALWKLRQQTTVARPTARSGAGGEIISLRRAIEQLTRQIRALQSQQEKMRAEIRALKKETARLSLERPYSYRAPPLNVE